MQTLSPAVISGIGTGMSVAGNLQAGSAARKAGAAQQAAAEYSARQLEVNAGQANAAAQRAAIEERRKSNALISRAIAVAAASGGGALDPTVMALVSGLSSEGQLAVETQLYGGEQRASAMRNQAAATRYEGQARAAAGRATENAYRLNAVSSVLNGVTRDWDGLGFKREGFAPVSESVTKYL